jgi:UDP-N-acetyl-D-mannosaminuronate dehydrogenase
MIAPHFAKGTLVVLESTTYPGTTDEDLRVVLEKGSGMKAGMDFHLAFSPEREDPANEQSNVKVIPKVVGCYTPACLRQAMALYSKAIDNIACLFLPRGGGGQTVGEHFQEREYRAGERAKAGVRRHGDRYLGSH